jgi:hypothetical protein
MNVKKRSLLTATFILMLLFSAAAGMHVELTEANFIVYTDFKDLLIQISSPVSNETYRLSKVMFSFNVTKPLEWSTYTLGSFKPRVHLTSVSYRLDGAVYGPFIVDSDLNSTFEYSTNLTNLKDGVHYLQVTFNGTSQSIDINHPWFSYDIPINGSSEIVHFTVDIDKIQPIVSVLSLGNITYNVPDVPLNFTVNEPVSEISYVLDGLDNVTLKGNTTLAGLSNGEHNVKVYATDEAGNTGASETMYFNVDTPEPFPTATAATAAGASVTIIGVGLLVYFKKRKHQTEMVGSK